MVGVSARGAWALSVSMALFAISSSIALASDADWTICLDLQNANGDPKIAACTAVIKSGEKSGRELSVAYAGRAGGYKAKGEYDKALADIDEAIKLQPGFGELFYNRGVINAAAGRSEEAMKDYNEALRLKPDLVVALSNRAGIYESKAQFQRAFEDRDQAVKLKPDYAKGYYNRGTDLLKMRQFDRAISDFDQAIKLQPDFAEAYGNRGTAYAELGQNALAIRDYSSEIILNPKSAQAFNGRGTVFQAVGQHERAMEDFSAALVHQPSHVLARANRCQLGAMKSASMFRPLLDCTSALKLLPNNPNIFHSLGIVYFRMGKYDSAIENFNSTLAIDGKQADSLFWRGQARRKKGDRAVGDADIAAAGAINPKYLRE